MAEHPAARRAARDAGGWRMPRPARDGDAPGALDRRRAAMHDELRLLARALSPRDARWSSSPRSTTTTPGRASSSSSLPDPERHTRRAPAVAARARGAASAGAHRSGGRGRAARAAGQLAVLADAGVAGRGAGGVVRRGRGRPRTGRCATSPREDVRVSPSRLHTLEECELNWVIGDLGGDPGGTTAGLGTIIHAALEHAEGSDEDEPVGAGRGALGRADVRGGRGATVPSARARATSCGACTSTCDGSRHAGGSLIGAEPHFEVAIPLEDAEAFEHGVILSGYIDRVELTPEGAVVIVDLKTGKSEPQTDAKVVDNPQLGAYQLAFEAGAIPRRVGHRPGGAKLLVLRPDRGEVRLRRAVAAAVRRRAARRLPRADPRRGRGDARHVVRRTLRGALPRRALLRPVPHPHDRGGERVVTHRPATGDAVRRPSSPPRSASSRRPTSRPRSSSPRSSPALVVAGAGSGKTETMAARVVWLVANGIVRRDEVLGLTFTRKAAGELAERIQRRLQRLAEFEARGARAAPCRPARRRGVSTIFARAGARRGRRAGRRRPAHRAMDALVAAVGADAAARRTTTPSCTGRPSRPTTASPTRSCASTPCGSGGMPKPRCSRSPRPGC